MFSKLLDVSEVFETFMYAITSHKKQRAKYQTEMLSHIAKTAVLVKRSSYKYSILQKKHPQTVFTDNQTVKCNNADGHSQTGNRVARTNSAQRIRGP